MPPHNGNRCTCDACIAHAVEKLKAHAKWYETVCILAGIDPDAYMGGHSRQDVVMCFMDEAGVDIDEWDDDEYYSLADAVELAMVGKEGNPNLT